VDLLPVGRKQIAKKYRPLVRLPDALKTRFEGFAITYEGKAIKNVKKRLYAVCDDAKVKRCSTYSFRHTAARWMRMKGVPPWQVAAQLGHSMGQQYAITERYAAYSPDYLCEAVKALSELVVLMRNEPIFADEFQGSFDFGILVDGAGGREKLKTA
jgi:integrase